ncbi:MAG: helix-turn-helix transcriptional regulator, partial [Desulfuromonadaceae bacterium]|nr:helix-turn-helix transcriptional regulator [Desulfuromonadaceae bacterium]
MKKVVDKRAALLSAALELFAENGFNASPTALIARRAGVASGTLFVYFKSKEELIRELFREVNQQFHALAWENFEELPIKERLLAALRQFLRYFLTHPKEFKFGEQYHFSPYFNSEPATS